MATKIQGITVEFPYKPYPSQLSMMNRIIQSLEKSQNCLVESPTGSGKSLALLCASLSWVRKQINERIKADEKLDIPIDEDDCCELCEPPPAKQKKKIFGHDGENDFMEDESSHYRTACSKCECHQLARLANSMTTEEKPIPKIFFGTRTHKQITQLVRELNKTPYKDMNMTVLSSRVHTCINPKVQNASNLADACQDILLHGSCSYNTKRKADSHFKLRRLGLSDAWDIEDLVEALKPVRACPYFNARDLVPDAHIVFCPYNYLLDPMFREAIELDLTGSILILDEAHNIEDAAREAASFSITEEQLTGARKDLAELIAAKIHIQHTEPLKNMVECTLRLMELTKSRMMRDGREDLSHVWTGLEIVSLLREIGIGPDRFSAMKKHFKILAEDASMKAGEEMSDRAAKKGARERSILLSTTLSLFRSLLTVLEFIFKDNFRFRDDYRIALIQSTTYERKTTPIADETETPSGWLGKRARFANGRRSMQVCETLSLNFWCLNSAVIFEELGRLTRCVVLTSGTLSPMVSFQSELGVDFPIRLEAGHVIKSDQIFVATLGEGPSGSELYASFKHYETYRFQDELGNLIAETCEVVPHGILCFLPSYSLLDKLVQRWESTGLTERIRSRKLVMLEPRKSGNFEAWMREFEAGIRASERGEGGGVLLLAVCRGKVSEGLDFADNFARLVITVGIPFPNYMNTQVQLKKAYNDEKRRTNQNTRTAAGPSPSNQLLSGSDWYEVQAYRAINQALGRCIRHRNDWGGILMVDKRFSSNPARYMSGVSKWLRSRARHFSSCREMLTGLTGFVADRRSLDDERVMEEELLHHQGAAVPLPHEDQAVCCRNGGEKEGKIEVDLIDCDSGDEKSSDVFHRPAHSKSAQSPPAVISTNNDIIEYDPDFVSSGFQKPLKFNALLPYVHLLDKEADQLFAEIKLNLARALASHDFYRELPYWLDSLVRYMNLYGYRFTKEDHVALVHITFNVFVEKRLDPVVIYEARDVLVYLLRHERLLSREDLVLDWRPLFDLRRYLSDSGPVTNGFVRLPAKSRRIRKRNRGLAMRFQRREWETAMDEVISKCRKFFPESSVDEIWCEFRSRLCPTYFKEDPALESLQLMNIFLPMYPKNYAEINHVVLPYILDMWQKYSNHTKYEKILVTLIRRASFNYVGLLDFTPHLDRLFNSLLRNLGLPVGAHGAVNTQSKAGGQPELSLYCNLVVYSIVPGPSGQQVLDRLRQLFRATGSFYHPSVRGSWTGRLIILLKLFAKALMSRVSRERHAEPWMECFGNVPTEVRLTDDHITEFIEILLPVCKIAIATSPRVAEALRLFAILRPKLVIPLVLDQFELARGSELDPQRISSCIMVLSQMHIPLLESGQEFPEGRLKLLPVLRALLPGIDINDPAKFSQTLNCIGNMVSCIRVEDVSSHAQDPGLKPSEKKLALVTGQFEDLILQLFDSILEGLAGVSTHGDFQQEMSRKADKTNEENSLLTQLYTVTMKLCLSTTVDIRRQILRKLVDFSFENILDGSVGKELRYLLNGVIQDDLKKTALDLFLPRFTAIMDELARDNHILYNGQPDNQLIWLLSILAGLASYCIVERSEQWLHILTTLWPLFNTKLSKCVSTDLLRCSMVNLVTDSLKMDATYLYPGSFHKQEWSAVRTFWQYASEKPPWIIRGPSHLAMAQNLIDTILDPILNRVSLYPAQSESFEQRELQCLCHWIHGFLKGGYAAMPRWEDSPVDLPEHIYRLTLTNNRSQIVTESGERRLVTALGGQNLRKAVLDRGIAVLEFAQEGSLDSDTFSAVASMCRVACIQENIASEDATALKTWSNHFTSLYLNKTRKREFGAITWLLRVQALHINRFVVVRAGVTSTVLRFAKALAPFVVSQYALQRREASKALYVLCDRYLYLVYFVVEAVLPYLDIDKESIEEHQFQGALECIELLSNLLELRESLYLIRQLYPAVCRAGLSKHCNKPSIHGSLQNIFDNFMDKNYSVTLLPFEPASVLDKLADQLVPGVDLSVCRTQGRQRVANMMAQRNVLYKDLIEDMIRPFARLNDKPAVSPESVQVLAVPWEPLNKTLELLPLQCDIPIPPYVTKFALQHIFHVVPKVSSTAAYTIIAILWTLRYRRRRLKLPTVTNNENPSPGIRPDNVYLLYDQNKNPLDSEEAWQKHPRVVHTHIGFQWWPETLKVRDYTDIPAFLPTDGPLNSDYLTNDEDKENYHLITNFFLEEETWTRLEAFLLSIYVDQTDDDMSGGSSSRFSDEFDEESFPLNLLITGVFRFTGLRCRERLERLFLRFVQEDSIKKEFLQKCSVMMLTGAMAGAKDWSREMLSVLIKDVVPPLITKFMELSPHHLREFFNDQFVQLIVKRHFDLQLLPTIVEHVDGLLNQWRLDYTKENMCYFFQLMFALGCSWRGASMMEKRIREWPDYAQHDHVKLRKTSSVALQIFLSADTTLIGADVSQAPFQSSNFLRTLVLPLIGYHVAVVLRSKSLEPSNATIELADAWSLTPHVPVSVDYKLSPDSSRPPSSAANNQADISMSNSSDTEDDLVQASNTDPSGSGTVVVTKDANWKRRIRSMNVLTCVIDGIASAVIHYAYSYPRAEIWQVLVLASDLFACQSLEHLEQTLQNCFLAFSYMQVTEANLSHVLEVIDRIVHHSSWKTRLISLRLIQQLVFNNLYTFSPVEVRSTVQLHAVSLLRDEVLEVRQEARVTLSGLVQCGYLSVDAAILTQLRQWSRVSGKLNDVGRLQRHSGVLGLCALVQAFPHDVPAAMPEILMDVCSHAHDPEPIRTTVKQTMASFSKTHHETWHLQRKLFSDDQLVVLTDMLVSPNYYA